MLPQASFRGFGDFPNHFASRRCKISSVILYFLTLVHQGEPQELPGASGDPTTQLIVLPPAALTEAIPPPLPILSPVARSVDSTGLQTDFAEAATVQTEGNLEPEASPLTVQNDALASTASSAETPPPTAPEKTQQAVPLAPQAQSQEEVSSEFVPMTISIVVGAGERVRDCTGEIPSQSFLMSVARRFQQLQLLPLLVAFGQQSMRLVTSHIRAALPQVQQPVGPRTLQPESLLLSRDPTTTPMLMEVASRVPMVPRLVWEGGRLSTRSASLQSMPLWPNNPSFGSQGLPQRSVLFDQQPLMGTWMRVLDAQRQRFLISQDPIDALQAPESSSGGPPGATPQLQGSFIWGILQTLEGIPSRVNLGDMACAALPTSAFNRRLSCWLLGAFTERILCRTAWFDPCQAISEGASYGKPLLSPVVLPPDGLETLALPLKPLLRGSHGIPRKIPKDVSRSEGRTYQLLWQALTRLDDIWSLAYCDRDVFAEAAGVAPAEDAAAADASERRSSNTDGEGRQQQRTAEGDLSSEGAQVSLEQQQQLLPQRTAEPSHEIDARRRLQQQDALASEAQAASASDAASTAEIRRPAPSSAAETSEVEAARETATMNHETSAVGGHGDASPGEKAALQSPGGGAFASVPGDGVEKPSAGSSESLPTDPSEGANRTEGDHGHRGSQKPQVIAEEVPPPLRGYDLLPGWRTELILKALSPGVGTRTNVLAVVGRCGTEVLVAFRGTKTQVEWILNGQAEHAFNWLEEGEGRTAAGFSHIFSAAWPALQVYLASLDKPGSRVSRILVSGYSLGGAVAALMAYGIALNFPAKVDAVLFGSPRTGDTAFAAAWAKRVNGRNISFSLDPIPRTPCTEMPACDKPGARGPIALPSNFLRWTTHSSRPNGGSGKLEGSRITNDYSDLYGLVPFGPEELGGSARSRVNPIYVSYNHICSYPCWLATNFNPRDRRTLCEMPNFANQWSPGLSPDTCPALLS
ncbi:uncharacterized protein LOC34617797 [Cyclospora cayetanensis]|uniref:Lipase domain-containing protein n=2 Tax=Cyclospora cayetanensis TaxID=88456 RepID=A0A1D3CR83_9EIME|nr:uncharacterized protein LOC34617797 [Cyclospora cayetanensis]OEH73710.1 lipase domain-containing protein [Cyclospora cayetanensis]